jgi:hypothetical protein
VRPTVLTCVLELTPILTVPLAVLIIGRDVALSLSAFYFRFISLPPPVSMHAVPSERGRSWCEFPENIHAILGLFNSLRRGSTDCHLQVQHCFAADTRRRHHRRPAGCSGRRHAPPRSPVRPPRNAHASTDSTLDRCTVAATTIASGLSYITSKTAIKYIQ